MRTLIIPDTHIASQYIPELRDILNEILSIKADRCIHLGDFFDNNKLNPEELHFGTTFAKALVDEYKDVTIMSGNGRHEWSNGNNVTSYLEFLDIQVVGMKIEKNIDGKKVFLGHGMTNQSKMEYGSHEYTVKELRKYDYAILGHQHQPQEIEKNIYHVGSIFFQHFNEVGDECKRVALIEDGELKFIPLKTPIKMYDAYHINELPNIPKKSKVRLVIKKFDDFKNWVDKLPYWKEHFYSFQHKLDFEVEHKREEKTEEIKEKLSSYQIFKDEVDKIKDKDVKLLIEKQL